MTPTNSLRPPYPGHFKVKSFATVQRLTASLRFLHPLASANGLRLTRGAWPPKPFAVSPASPRPASRFGLNPERLPLSGVCPLRRFASLATFGLSPLPPWNRQRRPLALQPTSPSTANLPAVRALEPIPLSLDHKSDDLFALADLLLAFQGACASDNSLAFLPAQPQGRLRRPKPLLLPLCTRPCLAAACASLPAVPNDCVSGTACFPKTIVGDATPPSNRLRCPTAKPCPLNAGLGQTPKPKRTHHKSQPAKA